MLDVPEDRQRGHSFALALSLIGEAMQQGIAQRRLVSIPIYDHHASSQANKYLLETIKAVEHRLGIIGLRYSGGGGSHYSIGYDVDEWRSARDKSRARMVELMGSPMMNPGPPPNEFMEELEKL